MSLMLSRKHDDTKDLLGCIAGYPTAASHIVEKHVVSIPGCTYLASAEFDFTFPC